MSLAMVIHEFVNCLQTIDGVIRVPDYPEPNLPADRTIFVRPLGGPSEPQSHSGEFGNFVYVNTDTLVIEYRRKMAGDMTALAVEDATVMLDRMRELLWLKFAPGYRENSVVQLMRRMDVIHFGDMSWGNDPASGFALTIEVTHGQEIPYDLSQDD